MRFIGLYALVLMVLAAACRFKPPIPAAPVEVVAHLASMPQSLHPTNNPSLERLELFTYLHGYLVREDLVSHELHPEVLSTLPEFQPADTSYLCHLNRLAQFDNGKPVTTYDVLFTLKINACLGVNNGSVKGNFANIADVRPLDSFTFSLEFREQNIQDIYLLSEFPILQASFYDSANVVGQYSYRQLKRRYFIIKDSVLSGYVAEFNGPKFGLAPNKIYGLGPYTITGWDNTHLVLEKKEHTWQQTSELWFHQSRADRIIFKLATDYTGRMLDLKNQAVDVSVGFNSKEVAELVSDTAIMAHYDIRMEPMYSHTLIAFNLQPQVAKRRFFFTDPLVRQAFAYLFPIQEAMDKLSNGVAMRVVGPISPNKSGYHKGLVPYPYDPDKGKALLAQAGWVDSNKDGILDKMISGKRVDFKVSFMCPPTSLFQAVSGIFVESLNQMGIGAELESPEDWRERFMSRHDFDMFFISVSNAPGPSYPFSLFRSEDFPSGNNFSGYANPLIDSLTAEVSRTFDPAARDALLYQIQEILHSDLPYLYVSTGRKGIAIHKKYKDVKTSGVLPMIMLNTLAPAQN